MFKGFKSKTMAISLCLFLLMAAFPASLSAAVNVPAFVSVEVNNTSVNAGHGVTFTIRTVGANYLFADTGGTVPVIGERQGAADAAGRTSWSLSFNPTSNQRVVVYANAVNAMEGAATITIPINVVHAAGLPQQPTPLPPQGQGVHRIVSVTEIEATQPNSVNLRIVTDDAAQVVWISPSPGRYMQAARVAGSLNTWEIQYRPQTFTPHQLQVSANHAYIVDDNMATQNVSIALSAPFVAPVIPIAITRLSASPSTIDDGGRTDISVRTTGDVRYVWATINGSRVNARGSGAAGAAGVRTWEFLNVRPNDTQTIRVYANTTDSTTGAVSDSVRVTVRDAVQEPRINSASANPSSIRWQGGWDESSTIEVRTNPEVTHVWARVDGGRQAYGTRVSSSGSEHRWEIIVRASYFQGPGSRNVTVYANTSSSTSGAATRNVNISVSEW